MERRGQLCRKISRVIRHISGSNFEAQPGRSRLILKSLVDKNFGADYLRSKANELRMRLRASPQAFRQRQLKQLHEAIEAETARLLEAGVPETADVTVPKNHSDQDSGFDFFGVDQAKSVDVDLQLKLHQNFTTRTRWSPFWDPLWLAYSVYWHLEREYRDPDGRLHLT